MKKLIAIFVMALALATTSQAQDYRFEVGIQFGSTQTLHMMNARVWWGGVLRSREQASLV